MKTDEKIIEKVLKDWGISLKNLKEGYNKPTFGSNTLIKCIEKALSLKEKQHKNELTIGRHFKTNYWELFYPDGTSSMTNFNPIEEIPKGRQSNIKRAYEQGRKDTKEEFLKKIEELENSLFGIIDYHKNHGNGNIIVRGELIKKLQKLKKEIEGK